MPFGTLNTKEAKGSIPLHSSPYPEGQDDFSDVEVLAVKFYTTADAVKSLLPEELEFDDEPLCTYSLIKYGFSPIGAYTEFVASVEVTWQGQKYNYALELILDNEGAIFSGREKYGCPKVFGNVVFDPSGTKPAPAGFVSGYVERPVGNKIIQFGFKPQKKIQEVGPLARNNKTSLMLRSIPSPNIGEPPALREFIELDFKIFNGEVWTGTGSLGMTGTSDFDPVHKLPIVRYDSSAFIRHGSATITPQCKVWTI